MKVLLINKFFYLKGGAERVFFDTKRLLEMHGHETIEFAMQHPENLPSPYAEFFVPEVEFKSIGGAIKAYKNIYSRDAQRRLEALIQQERPDIAHLHNAYFQISPSIFAVLKKYNIPVVYTMHDYHMVCPNYKMFTKNAACERCKKYRFHQAIINKCQDNSYIKSCGVAAVMGFNRLFKLYERGVDQFISPSKFLRKKVADWDFCDKSQITQVPNAVDLELFQAKTRVTSRKYFLYLGRFSSEKGIPTVIEAVKLLPKNIPVKIMGTGPFLPEVEKLAAAYENVEIWPFESDKQKIIDRISRAQAVIVPSIWYENYPMSVIESFACSTPVLGARMGGIPELVKNGETGFTFAAHDAKKLAKLMQKIYNNNDMIKTMGGNARAFVEQNNSFDAYYERLMTVYQRAYAKKHPTYSEH